MSASQVFVSIFEVLAICLAVAGLLYEERIARFERRVIKKFLRWVVRKYDARQERKNASNVSAQSEARKVQQPRVCARTYSDSADYVA